MSTLDHSVTRKKHKSSATIMGSKSLLFTRHQVRMRSAGGGGVGHRMMSVVQVRSGCYDHGAQNYLKLTI